MSIQFFDPVSAATQAIIDSLTNRSDDTRTTAGTITPTIPINCKTFTEYLTIGSGVATGTVNVSLSNTNRKTGEKFWLSVIAASTNLAVITVKDGAGTTIWTQTLSGVAHGYPPLSFTHNGTQFTSDQGAA